MRRFIPNPNDATAPPDQDGHARERHILVPLDGSPAAEAILPHAAGIARRTAGTLILLSTLPSIRDLLGLPFAGRFVHQDTSAADRV
jgi:nucleotide-binding universal stress UspA family protein